MNEQIEEMARIICKTTSNRGNCEKCGFNSQCSKFEDAINLYNEGYRKATDVAAEIFAEIEKFNRPPLPECGSVYILRQSEFAELKKKFTEDNNG